MVALNTNGFGGNNNGFCGNPFFHRGPILDQSYFFDRAQETAHVLAFLNAGQSVALVGQRGTGKTSLMMHLRDPRVLSQVGLQPQSLVFSYLDATPFAATTIDDIDSALLEQTKAVLEDEGEPIDLPEPKSPRKSLQLLAQHVARTRRRLIFQLDNFGILATNRHLDFSFYANLAGLTTRFHAAYVVTARQSLTTIPNFNPGFLASAFYTLFAQVQVGLLGLNASRDLISGLAERSGCRFHPQTVEFVLSLAGPHPLLLQIAGYYAFAYGAASEASIDNETAEQVRAAFLAEAEPHWSYSWSTLSPAQQKLLALPPMLQRASLAEIQRLEQMCVVTRRNGETALLSPPFQEFVARQAIPGLIQVPPVTIDEVQHIALLHGRPLALSPTEFALLAYLCGRAGQLVTHDELGDQLWGKEYQQARDPDRLKPVLRTLRRGLGDNSNAIENVRGIGYRFVCTG